MCNLSTSEAAAAAPTRSAAVTRTPNRACSTPNTACTAVMAMPQNTSTEARGSARTHVSHLDSLPTAPLIAPPRVPASTGSPWQRTSVSRTVAPQPCYVSVALLARRRLGLRGAELPTGDPQGVRHQPLPTGRRARCAAGLDSSTPLVMPPQTPAPG